VVVLRHRGNRGAREILVCPSSLKAKQEIEAEKLVAKQLSAIKKKFIPG